MAFQFSLQEVLDYRARIEEIRQGEMREARSRVEYVGMVIEQAKARRLHYREEMNRKIHEGEDYAHRELYWNYLKGLDNLIRRSEGHLEELHREMERRRERLEKAAREREVLEELKKVEKRQYAVAEGREEAKEYNELAIRNFLLSNREKSARSAEGART